MCIVRQVAELLVLQNFGEMNDELNKFERRMTDNKQKKIATYVLCFMARDLVKRLCFPIGCFSSQGFDSVQLFLTVQQAISWELLDFKFQQWFVMELHQTIDSTEFMNLQTEKINHPMELFTGFTTGLIKDAK